MRERARQRNAPRLTTIAKSVVRTFDLNWTRFLNGTGGVFSLFKSDTPFCSTLSGYLTEDE